MKRAQHHDDEPDEDADAPPKRQHRYRAGRSKRYIHVPDARCSAVGDRIDVAVTELRELQSLLVHYPDPDALNHEGVDAAVKRIEAGVKALGEAIGVPVDLEADVAAQSV